MNGKLRWQCRRGMKEIDALLEHFLDYRYADATPSEQDAFSAILDQQDPILYRQLIGQDQNIIAEQQSVIENIRQLG